MDAKELLSFIELLKNTSGSNDKQTLVLNNVGDIDLKLLLLNTYREDVQYGIKTFPDIKIFKEQANDNYKDILKSLVSKSTNKINYIVSELSKSNRANCALLRMILDRDLRIGLKAKSINKAYKENLIKEFKPIKPRGTYSDSLLPLYLDFKYNGARFIVEKLEGITQLKSSSGKELKIPFIKEQFEFLLANKEGIRLDCEIDGKPEEFGFNKGLYADDSTRLTTNGWVSSSQTTPLVCKDKLKKLKVSVFDIVSLSEAYQYKKDSKDSKILLDRVKELESLFTGLTFPNITFSKMIYVKDPKTLR